MRNEKTFIFEQNRSTLEGIAYRMLGTLADAQDVVQDTYIKWHETNEREIQNSRAWLITVCTRLAINILQSARANRENYVGIWLPEPFVGGDSRDTSQQLELDETISVALLLALEKLSPTERAVYILHDVFDYHFDEISNILEKTNANCRQLATRARKKIREGKPKFVTSPKEHRRLLRGFLQAAREGKVDQFKSLLADSVELYADGGGKVEAIPKMLYGNEAVGKFFVGIWNQFAHQGIVVKESLHWFNGSPGILIFEDDELATAMTLDISEGQIQCIYAVRNPDKLISLRSYNLTEGKM